MSVPPTVTEIIAPPDRARVASAIERRKSGAVDTTYYVVTARDKFGERFDVEVSGSRVFHEGVR